MSTNPLRSTERRSPDCCSIAGHAASSNADVDLLQWLPDDVATSVLKRAGGAAALQATRSTSRKWKILLDSLIIRASCNSIPLAACSSASLMQLPNLHTIDFSGCCEPLPAGKLEQLLKALSQVPKLRSLKLSTWCLALDHGHLQQHIQLQPTAPAVISHSAAASGQPAFEARCFDLVLPAAVALLTSLQELSIAHCAEVTPPLAQRVELPAAIMRLPLLTKLELSGTLPVVHHLRGLRHLQHLTVSLQTQQHTPVAAPTAAWTAAHLMHMAAAVSAVAGAISSASALHTLQIQMPTSGSAAAFSSHHAAELLSMLCQPQDKHTLTAAAPHKDRDPPDSRNCQSHGYFCNRTGGWQQVDNSSSSSNSADTLTEGCGLLRPSSPHRRLRHLQLTGASSLYHLPAKFIATHGIMQHLNLSRTQLSADAVAALGALSQLTSLHLAEAGLRSLPSSWAQLNHLEVMDLNGNPLGTLPACFGGLRSLSKLLLSCTHLLELPACISTLTQLQHLDVASNKLQELPEGLCSCVMLHHLDASKNRLLTLPPGFSALSHITQLSLTGNHLEAIPSGLQHLVHLANLGLALNYYKSWSHAAPCFSHLADTLQDLELQHTATVLDDAAGFLEAVGQLTSLTSLAAGSNQLSELPETWQDLKRLKVLQLSHNAIEVLPTSLVCLSALTHLDVSYNRLTSVPSWIGSGTLQQLRRLNLAKNHLTCLPLEMGSLSLLTQLQLQGNNLATAPACLGELQQLRILNIGGNYKLKECGLGQQLAALPSLRDVVLPYRLAVAAGELRRVGKAVQLD